MFNFVPIQLLKAITNVRRCCKSCHQVVERTTCVLVPGDGIGPELVDSVQCLFDAHSIPIDFVTHVITKKDESSFYEALESITKYGICLKSAFENYEPALHGDYQNYNVRLRTLLDIYANVVHIKSLPNVKTRHKDLDFIIVREQTEASYRSLEHESVKGLIECLKIITWKRSWRIAKFGFDYATKFDRKTVTCVHKANIMKLSDGLFLRCCEEMSKWYPKLKFNSMIVDNCMSQMVSKPSQFDVIIAPNLYGNIADNLGAGLVGGAGIVPGASYGDNCVLFEPAAHHTYHEAMGKNIANPTAMLLCASKMLRHVNMLEEAVCLKSAVMNVLQRGKIRTPDIGGTSSTTEFTQAVIDVMHRLKHEENVVSNV